MMSYLTNDLLLEVESSSDNRHSISVEVTTVFTHGGVHRDEFLEL